MPAALPITVQAGEFRQLSQAAAAPPLPPQPITRPHPTFPLLEGRGHLRHLLPQWRAVGTQANSTKSSSATPLPPALLHPISRLGLLRASPDGAAIVERLHAAVDDFLSSIIGSRIVISSSKVVD